MVSRSFSNGSNWKRFLIAQEIVGFLLLQPLVTVAHKNHLPVRKTMLLLNAPAGITPARLHQSGCDVNAASIGFLQREGVGPMLWVFCSHYARASLSKKRAMSETDFDPPGGRPDWPRGRRARQEG